MTEVQALKQFEPFIVKSARQFARTSAEYEDFAQEGRIAVFQALRAYVEGEAAIETHCMRNAHWRIAKMARAEHRNRRKSGSNFGLEESEILDRKDFEAAVIAVELFERFSAADQAKIAAKLQGIGRGGRPLHDFVQECKWKKRAA